MTTFGFSRSIEVINSKSIVSFIAPNGVKLQSQDEIKKYLTSPETCKCGLSSKISLNSFNFDPSYVPPGIKLRLHRNGTKWRTDPEPVNLKRFGPKVEPAKEPPLKKSKTENSKNLKNSNLQKSKKRNLESIMAKIEEARERKISSESNTTPEKNVRKPAPSGDENKNNSNSSKNENIEDVSKNSETEKKKDDFEIEDYVIIDSFSDCDQKDVSRVSTPDSVYEEKIFDQFREKLNNSFHFKNVEMETELPQTSPSLQKNTTHTAQAPNQFKDKSSPSLEFDIGDLVWGRYSGCPAWPAIVVDPSFVDAKSKKQFKSSKHKHLWIMWYGDRTFAKVSSAELKGLEEGLTSPGSTIHRKTSKRVTERLDRAIEEVLVEYSKKEKRSKLRKRKRQFTP